MQMLKILTSVGHYIFLVMYDLFSLYILSQVFTYCIGGESSTDLENTIFTINSKCDKKSDVNL